MIMNENNSFIENVLNLFNGNFSRIIKKVDDEKSIITYDLVVFSTAADTSNPILDKNNNDKYMELPDYSGFWVTLTQKLDQVKIAIEELKFGLKGQPAWVRSGKPIEVNVFTDHKLFKKFQDFQKKYNNYVEDEEEKRAERIKTMFIESKVSFDDPVVAFFKNSRQQDAQTEAFQDGQPDIMDFMED